MGVASGEVILGRPGSFVTGTPVAAAARLVRFAQPGEVVVGERAAAATAGAFELQQRNGAYLLVGSLAPTRSPAQIATQRRRRRVLLLAGALLAIAAIASGAVYLLRPGAITVPPNSVGIIDPKTNKVVGDVPVGSRPDAIVVAERGAARGVWVANLEPDKTLMRIDPDERTVERTISLLGRTPTGLAVGFRAVWVAHGYLGMVSRISPQYAQVDKTIRPPFNRVGFGARGILTVGAGSVWVAFGDSSVSRIDPASGHVEATMYAGNTPSAIAFGIRSIWVTNQSDSSLTRINPATNDKMFEADEDVGLRPSGAVVGGDAVWVTDTGDDHVSRFDPGSGSATSIPVGDEPTGIAYGAGSVWVTNSGDGTVSRIDPLTRKVVETIRVGNSPSGIAVGDGYVWVTVQPVTPTS
jgi:YVTN family beta-propeller protein